MSEPPAVTADIRGRAGAVRGSPASTLVPATLRVAFTLPASAAKRYSHDFRGTVPIQLRIWKELGTDKTSDITRNFVLKPPIAGAVGVLSFEEYGARLCESKDPIFRRYMTYGNLKAALDRLIYANDLARDTVWVPREQMPTVSDRSSDLYKELPFHTHRLRCGSTSLTERLFCNQA